MAAWQLPLAAQDQAQGRGARAGGAPAEDTFPSAEQFANSKEAQTHVAAATKIGGSDQADPAKRFCTNTRPPRGAPPRHAPGPPPPSPRPAGPRTLVRNGTPHRFND